MHGIPDGLGWNKYGFASHADKFTSHGIRSTTIAIEMQCLR